MYNGQCMMYNAVGWYGIGFNKRQGAGELFFVDRAAFRSSRA